MDVDLAILGSGFAAFEIARTARGRGLSVVVVERGLPDLTPAARALSRVPFTREPVVSGGFDFGAQVPDGFDGLPRFIGLGGTSQLWSGKWRPLDRVDLTRRIDDRQWPIEPEALAPFYDGVARDYGWPDWSADTQIAGCRDLVASSGLRLIELYEERQPVRLRDKWLSLAEGGRLDLMCGASVRRARFDGSGRVLRGIEVATDGGVATIDAREFVIACGGIESVHVGHAIRRDGPRRDGLPARYEGYCDHPKAYVGTLRVERNAALLAYAHDVHASLSRVLAFSLPEEEVAASGLGNHTVFLWPPEQRGDPFQIAINLEQLPEPRNFIAVEPPSVSWRLTERTWNDFDAFMRVFLPRLASLFGHVSSIDAPAFKGASHPAACLPMSASPADGVLDAQCRFHEYDNVACVSAAGFPLPGSANPTMTVVALARRYGEEVSTVAA